LERYLKKTIKTYNRIASSYVQATYNRQPKEEFHVFSQMIMAGKTILDAGCGGGRDCKAFAERGFHVIGIDLSAEMLKIARNLAPGCEFQQADLRKIPLPNNSIDGIWCCASLLHLKRKEVHNALIEFKRVLKEKAVCCILVKKGTGEKFVRDSRSQGKPRFYSYFQPDEVRDLCQSLGFVILLEKATTNSQTKSDFDFPGEDWLYFLLQKP
jgi:ubiquinone/menaquinone biosynthesis C-methylase UbiE